MSHWKLLTIDIWDTLLRRNCHPDCVKLHVCRWLLITHGRILPRELKNTQALLRARQQAEKEIGDEARARGLDDEYSILDVYSHWLKLLHLDPLLEREGEKIKLIEQLLEIEIDQEKQVGYPDPGIREQIEQISCDQRLFLSDFYMPAKHLVELLQHHQLDQLVNDGVSSCDIGLNKRSGRIYSHLHQALNVIPEQHIHIGDNRHSDISRAKALGITTIHYQPESEHILRTTHERSFKDRAGAVTEAQRTLARDHDTQDPAYAYGRETALLWVSFALHIMQQAVTERVERILFFTREGDFFMKVYQRLAMARPLGFDAPPCALLEVSRLATFGPSLPSLETDQLMRLWRQYSIQTPRGLLASLGVEPEDYTELLHSHDLELDNPVTYPWKDQRVKDFLNDDHCRQPIEQQLSEQRTMLLAYLEQQGVAMNREQSLAIVDIGWRGTIQDNLAYLLPDITWHGHYLALNRFLNPQPPNTTKSAWGPNLNNNRQLHQLLNSVAPMEMLCNSPDGSVTGYRQRDGRIDSERLVDAEENRIHDSFTRSYQKGVLDTVDHWAELIHTQAYTAWELRPQAMKLWQKIINDPPAFLAQGYFRLNHNETFGVGGFMNKGERISTLDLLLACCSSSRRQRVVKFIREIGWLPGLYRNPDVGSLFKLILRSMIRVVEIRNRLLKRG